MQFLHPFSYTRQTSTSESENYVHDAQKENKWLAKKTYLSKHFRCKFGIIVAKTRFFNLWSVNEQVIIIMKFLLKEMRQTKAEIRSSTINAGKGVAVMNKELASQN